MSLRKAPLCAETLEINFFAGIKYCYSSFSNIHILFVPSMAFCSNVSDWEKKRRQAQPYINRIRFEQEKRLRWSQQISFLRRCDKSGLVPRGLRLKIPASIERSQYGKRMKSRSEKRVLRRAISDLYVKIKKADIKIAEMNLVLSQELQMPNGMERESEDGC